MNRAAVVALALMTASPAYALDAWMWGVGPKVGTMALPGQFPMAFPPAVKDEGELAKVRGDVILGVDAVYYANSSTRLGASGAFDVGKGFYDMSAMIEYNWVTQSDALDFILGAGAGAGTMKWTTGQASLRVPYYPLRGEIGALIRDQSRGYQGTVFAQYNLPSNHFYTDALGAEVEVGRGIYFTVGVEVAVMFGDFTPPRPKKKAG